MTDTFNYAMLKALAEQLGRPLATLIALSHDNDPFVSDRPGRRLDHAKWFAGLWETFEFADGVHLRRIHYRLVVTPSLVWPNGERYANTYLHWHRLCTSASDARYLDFVPAGAFVDRRAPEPLIFVPHDIATEASLGISHTDILIDSDEDLPSFDWTPNEYEFPPLPNLILSRPEIVEPYAIELWSEKSTQNDVLLPLARSLGITLVTGVGELSITACHGLLSRIREHGRRTRIFYISDHDPSGENMPVSVSRKIEFLLRRDSKNSDLDICLQPLVLTPEQVAEYDLPRAPIKDSDKGRTRFEERHGTGATELDALEELRPGELERLIREAVARYRRPTRLARNNIARKAREIDETLIETRQDVLASHADAIARARTSWETAHAEIESHQEAITEAFAALDQYRNIIEQHQDAIEAKLDGWRESAAPLWNKIGDDLEAAAPDLAAVEWPEPVEADDDDDALYDSQRSYVDQIDRYKLHQGKPTTRRERRKSPSPRTRRLPRRKKKRGRR
jgi:hypothetical protein